MSGNQKQRSTYDCMLASIATVLHRDYDELWTPEFRQEIEDAKGCYGKGIERAFAAAGLVQGSDYWTVYIPEEWAVRPMFKHLLRGRRALLQVPSLNHQGAQHIVCWLGDALHDPSNKQIYQWLEQCAPAFVWIFNEIGPR